MRDILRKSFYRNGYLLIIAAWLYTISFIFSNYSYYRSSPERVKARLETFIKNSEEKFNAFSRDTAVLKSLVTNGTESEKALDYVNDAVNLYVYVRNDAGNLLLIFWNNHKVTPTAKDLEQADGKYFSVYPNGEFEFIKKTFYLNGKQVTTAAVVPIRWNYFFETKYLKTEFAAVANIENTYDVVKDYANIYIKNGDGKVIFGLKEKKKVQDIQSGWVSLALRVIAIIFVLIFINMLANEVVQKKGWVKGFLLLTVLVLFLRFLSYQFAFPFNFRKGELFDPIIYGSNSLHPSLGDLLINMILLFWLLSFFKSSARDNLKAVSSITQRRGWILTGVLSILMVVLAFTTAGVVRSLITDSKISYDVVNFFSLSIYTLISFIILCLIIFIFFYLSHLILLFLYKVADVPPYMKYVAVTVCGLIYLTINIHSASSISNLVVLGWLLAYMFLMEYRKEDILLPVIKSSFFLVWLIFFAGSIASLIIYQNKKVEIEQRKKAAEKLASLADPAGESIMSIGIANFSIVFLAKNFDRLTVEASNKAIKDSLINENFSGFLNKYDTRIYTYNNNFQPLFNEDSVSYDVITNIIYNQSKRTSIKDVYYYESNTEGYSFLYQKEIRDSLQNDLGYFFVVAKPKRYTAEALYPELFKQGKDNPSDIDLNYAYAIYNKGTIINNFGDYNFVSRIPKQQYPKQDYIEKKAGQYSELWYNAGNNKLVIVVKGGSLFIASITLFAYLLGSFLFLVVLLQIIEYLMWSRFSWKRIKSGFTFNIRTQIQSTIIFISIFSFLVIGIATISFYIKRFSETNRERLVKAIQIMSNEIESQIQSHTIFDDVVKIYDLGASNELERRINEISEIHNIDINFYDLAGNLKVSTQPYIYKKKILSEMMEPLAYYRLHYNQDIQFIQEESVGRFSYLSIYVPVRDEAGEPYAYLNIPYLNSQKELKQEISSFLVTLIVLNAFIFVVAGAIALLLTNRITNSFTLIGSKMKDINLGKANEEISWNTKDEIGALVNEYNKMVKKLEESAQALAKSEREGAWREMARQVAHEIKNPLTPMKLSIQYLQRAIREKNPDMQMLAQKVASTLVEQIDQLAKIASDFSQFANIGNVKMEDFDVTELLGSLINLYNTNEKLNISWNKPKCPAIIRADRSQINRLFTNLLQNAIEASPGGGIINITINEEIEANKLMISIKDDGVGIPAEKHDKIFTPNFTTKSSGTGLGLAMCKGIVEKANGRIWFETTEGAGTTFYVLLPLVGLPA
ncbi:MAG: HAMP domain-containing sensor histidine kinase [Segetibacter sp.]